MSSEPIQPPHHEGIAFAQALETGFKIAARLCVLACGVFFVSLTVPGAFQRVFVHIGWHGRKMAVPLSELEVINRDESAQEGLGDWPYSVSMGYCP
jgi:calcium binding protein